MQKLQKWFEIFAIILLQVVLVDGPNSETVEEIEENSRNSVLSESKPLNIDQKEQEVPYGPLLLERKIRSTSNDFLQSQFDRHCKEYQPCTCYYPDHPNVMSFELSTDEFTINASNINGTGPGNCEDLQRLGYTLEGFHFVRFNSIRVKAIYCIFNQTSLDNTTKASRIKRALDNNLLKPKPLKFCGGFGNKSCSFSYPDYPDVKTVIIRNSTNISNGDNSKEGPKSCENLKQIGNNLAGFYMVRLNAIKLKAIYCDFNDSSSKNVFVKKEPFCNGFGSQPCSCYFSIFRDIIQFELSSDETTRSASKANGTGPASCQDLENVGHRLNGFYMIRFKDRVIKVIFCNFKKNHETQIIQKVGKTTKKSTKLANKIVKKSTTTSSTTSVFDDEDEQEAAESSKKSTKQTYKRNRNIKKSKSAGVLGEVIKAPFGILGSVLGRGRRNISML